MSALKNSWKNYILSNSDLDSSNNHFAKIKDLADPSYDFEEVFEIVSKNQGIAFIALDPSESTIQLYHHCHVFGGSWDSPTKTFCAILGVDDSARPVQIVEKSDKQVKTKSISFDEIIGDDFSIKNLEDAKQKKIDIQVQNIMPIPHILTKAYLSVDKVDPHSIAQAFYIAMREFDMKSKIHDPRATTASDLVDEDFPADNETPTKNTSGELLGTNEKEDASVLVSNMCLSSFVHILQFCHICFLKKVRPILFSVNLSPEVSRWFDSLTTALIRPRQSRQKRQSIEASTDYNSDSSESSPDLKVSRKDQIFINTLLKLHDSMDKFHREKSDKEPGFSRLEEYRKNLILNASAIPPFTTAAATPTEFYTSFLAKRANLKPRI
jgi:hypothetical protein